MKKNILLSFCFCIASFAFSQEHLSFLGIPLDGSISSFSKKLEAKNYYYDENTSQYFGKGSSCFVGKFAGQETDNVIIKYNRTKNFVYSADVIFKPDTKLNCIEKIHNFEKIILDKYNYCTKYCVEDENNTHVFFVIYNSEYDCLGSIELGIFEFEDEYRVSLNYEDDINSDKDYRLRQNDI